MRDFNQIGVACFKTGPRNGGSNMGTVHCDPAEGECHTRHQAVVPFLSSHIMGLAYFDLNTVLFLLQVDGALWGTAGSHHHINKDLHAITFF